MSWTLVSEIMTAAGPPVAGHTLSVEEVQRAVAEGRVLEIYLWGSMGDSLASFGFAKVLGVDHLGRVHPSFLVFPKPIPPELRRASEPVWEEMDEVFAAFGVDP